jgi:S-adenosylmethionine-diacylgycerolhomoserine-N-methlytransferase
VSVDMLDTARRTVEREGLSRDIRLAYADAMAFDPALRFGLPGFARIFVSYGLSMMPGWQAVLARALIWLAPGGELHVVDFGGQEGLCRPGSLPDCGSGCGCSMCRRATGWKAS